MYLSFIDYLNKFCNLQLSKRGKVEEAEVEFERLLGVNHVKSALADLTRSDRGDASENVKYSDLFYGHHFRGKGSMHTVHCGCKIIF